MNNQDFTTTIWADETPASVFKTLLDVRTWWSGLYDESFEGASESLGDEFSFLAGGGMHDTRQKLIELQPNKKVTWLVTEANLSFVDKKDEWKGSRIMFELSGDGCRTKVVFTHAGLNPSFECYDACAPAWTKYIHQQLTAALKMQNHEVNS